MLHYIFGPAKSGKSSQIAGTIASLTRSPDARILLLVPEQFTFETEQEYYRMLGDRRFSQLTVTSFTRLSQEIFRQFGGIAGSYADDAAKAVLMEIALDEVRDMLEVYADSAKGKEFGKDLLHAVTELKYAGVEPEQLEGLAGEMESGYLAQKLRETALLARTYDALLHTSYLDPLDDLTRAVNRLQGTGYFQQAHVFLDAFKGFTAPEYEFIRLLLQQAAEVTVSLCLDERRMAQNRFHIFSTVEGVYQRLNRMARELGVRIEKPLSLQETHFTSPELAFLEQHLFSPQIPAYEGENHNVCCLSCRDEYDEVECTAAMIAGMIQQQGYHMEEIAVISRDLETYLPKIESIFPKYNLCYYTEKPAVSEMPLFRFVRNTLDCLTRGMTGENVLSLLKCGLTPFSVEEVAELENYIYVWNITAAQWKQPFTRHPRGFQEELGKEDVRQLARVEALRDYLVSRLERLREQAFEGSAREIGKALFTFLEEMGVRGRIEAQMEAAYEREDFAAAQEQSQAWELLTGLLDTLCAAAGDRKWRISRYASVFSQAADTCRLGSLPQALDVVLVGSADQVRFGGKKAVFVLGANENVLPCLPDERGIFSSREREILLQMHLELSGSVQEQMQEERFIAYQALTSPLQKLVLTARRADISGAAKLPSVLFLQLKKMFGEKTVVDSSAYSGLFFCRSKAAAYSWLASHFTEDTPETAAVKALLNRDPEYAKRLEALSRPLEQRAFQIRDRETAQRLFGSVMNLSPTRIESFYQCRFRYFLEQGMRAFPLKKADLDPLETGTLIHKILYDLMQEMDIQKEYDREWAKNKIAEELDEYIETVMGGVQDKTGRFLYLYRRLQQTVLRIVDQLYAELRQSRFTPCAYEYEITPDADVTPLRLMGEDGTVVNVAGKIDRIDSFVKENGEKYIRIIDYKSGRKIFKLNDVLYGLNLQMLIYLQCISQNGRGSFASALPAGILYMPAGEQVPTLDRHATAEDVALARQKSYGMNGLLIEDPEVLFAMEEQMQGIFIPVTCKKDGNFSAASYQSLVTLTELAEINRYIDRLILQMARELHQGRIEALPLEGSCAYCRYRAVCGITRASQVRAYQSFDRAEVFSHMKQMDILEPERRGKEDGADIDAPSAAGR